MTKISEYDAEFHEPEWFYRNLYEDSFPWELGRSMSFSDFQSKYTLHDSGWGTNSISLGFDSLILVIDWDAVWLPDLLKTQIEEDYGRVYLLIKLSEVEEVKILNRRSMPPSFIGIVIGHEFVEIDNKKILSISDVAGGDMDITYTGEEVFFAITEQQTILKL